MRRGYERKGSDIIPRGRCAFIFRRTEIITQVEARPEPEAVMPENTKTKKPSDLSNWSEGKKS